MRNWTREIREHPYHPEIMDYALSTKGVIGLNSSQNNAHEIEAHHHFNGSGDKAFGGAKWWPVVSLTVSFQTGEEIKRDAFVEKLKAWLEENLPS